MSILLIVTLLTF